MAEDLVQATFLSALRGAGSFQGRSGERTWLVGILKHKVVDHFRRARREFLSEELETREGVGGEYIDRQGHWRVGQAEWLTQPERAVEREEFWKALNGCLEHLSEGHRKVFVLRELEEQEAEDICQALGISLSNLWVSLHRARLQLRACLRQKGLG